jgi:hypothetical protein
MTTEAAPESFSMNSNPDRPVPNPACSLEGTSQTEPSFDRTQKGTTLERSGIV